MKIFFQLIFLFQLLILMIKSNQNTLNNPIECIEKCPNYFNCNNETGKCEHKGFFPIYPVELLQLIIFVSISMIATSVGIGGGTVYSSLLMFIDNLQPNQAYPISTFIISICSCCTFYMGVRDKLENPSANFVDYDLAIIFCPTLLLGTKFGTIFNKTFSSTFLILFLTGFVFNNIINIYRKANDARRKEMQIIQQRDDLKSLLVIDNINPINKSIKTPKKKSFQYEIELEMEQNSSIIKNKIREEEDNPTRWDRLKYLIMFLSISIVDLILEGSSKVPSIIGAEKCGKLYWFLFILYIFVSLYLVDFSRKIVKNNYEYKLSLSKEFKNKHLDALEQNFKNIIILTFLGGVVTGMLGIGGGMITTPLLLKFGLDPKVNNILLFIKAATSTSNLLIIFSAVTGSFLFIFSGQLNVSFALCIAIPCAIGALYGSKLINEYINRTQRSSILIYFLLYFLIGTLIILLITSYNKISEASISKDGNGIFRLNNFCN